MGGPRPRLERGADRGLVYSATTGARRVTVLPPAVSPTTPLPGEPAPPPYTLTEDETLAAALNASAPATTYRQVVGLYPTVVFLRTVRSASDVAHYLVHECRHVWQFAMGHLPGWSEEQAEADANAYRQRVLVTVVRRFTTRRERSSPATKPNNMRNRKRRAVRAQCTVGTGERELGKVLGKVGHSDGVGVS